MVTGAGQRPLLLRQDRVINVHHDYNLPEYHHVWFWCKCILFIGAGAKGVQAGITSSCRRVQPLMSSILRRLPSPCISSASEVYYLAPQSSSTACDLHAIGTVQIRTARHRSGRPCRRQDGARTEAESFAARGSHRTVGLVAARLARPAAAETPVTTLTAVSLGCLLKVMLWDITTYGSGCSGGLRPPPSIRDRRYNTCPCVWKREKGMRYQVPGPAEFFARGFRRGSRIHRRAFGLGRSARPDSIAEHPQKPAAPSRLAPNACSSMRIRQSPYDPESVTGDQEFFIGRNNHHPYAAVVRRDFDFPCQ